MKSATTDDTVHHAERMGPRDLLIASKEFANEHRWMSWWHLGSTLFVYAILLSFAVSDLSLVLRIACSLVLGFVHVRLFVIYHDFQHGAVLQKSKLATLIMWLYGMYSLNPPSVWNRSHDHHHAHNSKTFGPNVGSYPILTTDAYKDLPDSEKFRYRVSRHPLTILLGYVTVFLWGMSIRPFLQNPVRHFDGLLSVVIHFSLCFLFASYGLDVMILGFGLPAIVASCIGAYLFYAQHNFPSARLRRGKDWSHVDAALHSSSYMRMGRLMRWFTGNIGYHHVHHLNARIPFYRLPEAMNALTELQSPRTTTLGLADVRKCLRLSLWDDELDRLVSFDEC